MTPVNPYKDLPFHPESEKLVQTIANITMQDNIQFYRVMVAYFMSIMASTMNTKVRMGSAKPLPVNFFGINLAPSGTAKDYSLTLVEEQVVDQFMDRFLNETVPLMADANLPKLAHKRAVRNGTDPDEELARIQKEYDNQGEPVFSFDDATIAALRQFRHKLLMSNIGALNLQINEISANLLSKQDVVKVFIELYDGKLKSALTKNTQDNKRSEEIPGRLPANMLLFGTPMLLLEPGTKEKKHFEDMLQMGYARRCFFAYYNQKPKDRPKLTAEEEMNRSFDTANQDYLAKLSDKFVNLADMINAHKEIQVPTDVLKKAIEYKHFCEDREANINENDIVLRQEMKNRHFKVLKLAAAYAFVDQSPEVTEDHLNYAIRLAEDSGEDFRNIMKQDKAYVKLAKGIASQGEEMTQADLDEKFPFYSGNQSRKQELLQMAISWGYKNNIIIKRAYQDSIEFIRGETLKKTDLTQIPISWSTDIATGYQNEFAPFDMLHKVTQSSSLHWVAHHLRGGHRQEDNVEEGFSVVVLDVDGGVPLKMAKELLKNYKYLIYTTKRHTEEENRFRIVLPTNYQLEMDEKEYKEFMKNIYEWMPFEVDTATGQRARKWMSYNGQHWYNDGELLDVLPFIPKTAKNEEHRKRLESQKDMDNLERWVINNTGDGNRNNMLLRYAMLLADAGFDYHHIYQQTMNLNNKMVDSLAETEIATTIMVTVAKRTANNQAQNP